MSLTVKHLNNDASFLLTFEPIRPFRATPDQSTDPFTIILDPWLSGASKIWHSKFSVSTHKVPACISSLAELPEPDLVIISQDKTDHCHEATLKTLPSSGTKTTILADPASAKAVKSWKYFEQDKVVSLQKFEDPTQSRVRRKAAMHRIILPPLEPGGTPGEVAVAYLPQKHDITGLHSAIGITYRPPTYSDSGNPLASLPLTPPASPNSLAPYHPNPTNRPISVIYSPHGISYKTLQPYVTSHLIAEAALPLTALLHCFDSVNNPWYLGGNISAGFPVGAEIAQSLLAKYWISAHDGDKDTKGFASTRIVTRKFEKEEVEEIVSPRSEKFPERKIGTEVVVLDVGEEISV